MANNKLVWDQVGERLYETGISKVALFVQNGNAYDKGVAWNGVTAINEKPEGGEPTDLYADDEKYLSLYSKETLKATLEAYTYPEEFEPCDGVVTISTGVTIGQQTRKGFGLAYKTIVGNDTANNDYGCKYHLLYGCKASPSEKDHSTVNDSPDVSPFSWELTTTSIDIPGFSKSSSVTVDSTKVDSAALKVFEGIIYGADEFAATKTYAKDDVVEKDSKLYACKTAVTTPGEWSSASWTEVGAEGPRLPLPDELVTIFQNTVG